MGRLFGVIRVVLVCVVAMGAGGAMAVPLAQAVSPSVVITAQLIRESCTTEDRRVVVNLRVQGADVGLPGAIFVGIHDDAQTAAYFLNSRGEWESAGGGLFTPFAVLPSGLQSTSFSFAAPPTQAWNLYAGYGALTPASEASVQQSIEVYARAKAANPNGRIASVDPDHIRLTLIQKDMTEKNKYDRIARWNSIEYRDAPSANGYPCSREEDAR